MTEPLLAHTPVRRSAPAAILATFAATAVITGVTHAGIIELRRVFGSHLTFAGPDLVWMAPLAYLIYFLIAAVPLAVANLLWPQRRWPRLAAFIAFALGGIAIVLLFSSINRIAGIALALGVAAALTRRYSNSEQVTLRAMRRVASALVLLVAAISIALRVARARGERNQLSALVPAVSGVPNVLLVIFDTVRASSVGLYGYSRRSTPVIDSLGHNGVVFDWAFSPAPWTLPSHASMFTGRRAGSLSADWRKSLDGAARTLAEVLRDRGYATAGFTANVVFASVESGVARGFTHYEDFRATPMQVLWTPSFAQTYLFKHLVSSRSVGAAVSALKRFDLGIEMTIPNDRKRARDVTDEMLRWQAGAPRRPFFAFLNYFDAHDPYDPSPPYDRRFGGGARPIDHYDGGIAYADTELGRLLHELTVRGVLKNTIVIVTADHGEAFGEHGLTGHGKSVDPEVVHVPLLIYAPRFVPAGVRVPTAISTSRLAATVLDLVGMPTDTMIPGRSLMGRWRSDDTTATVPVLTEMGPDLSDSSDPKRKRLLKAVIDDVWYYIHDGDGHEQLYSYRTDSALKTNLVTDPAYDSTRARYRSTLAAMVGRQGMVGRVTH